MKIKMSNKIGNILNIHSPKYTINKNATNNLNRLKRRPNIENQNPGQPVICPSCIGQITAYDPTQWLYTSSIPTSPSTAVECNSGSGGDPYLGIITNYCECDSPQPTPPIFNGIPYLFYEKDCPPFSSWCIGSGYYGLGHCNATGNGYGSCGFCDGLDHNKYHYFYARDWSTELQGKEQTCCVLPSTTSNRTQQCPPDLWSGAPVCDSIMYNVCSPTISSGQTQNNWTINSCDNYMSQILQLGKTTAAGSILTNALDNYITNLNNSTPSTNDPFIPTIINWCTNDLLTGICTPYLNQICSNVTPTDLLNDTTGNLTKMCACYMSPSNSFLPGFIPSQCNANCVLSSSLGGIPQYTYASGSTIATPLVCEQNSCVMDNITVNIVNSNITGGTTLNQICGNCTQGSCTCILNNININEINDVISGGNNISQYCGNTITNTNETFQKDKHSKSKQSFSFWWLLFFILIIIIIWYLYYLSKNRKKNK